MRKRAHVAIIIAAVCWLVIYASKREWSNQRAREALPSSPSQGSEITQAPTTTPTSQSAAKSGSAVDPVTRPTSQVAILEYVVLDDLERPVPGAVVKATPGEIGSEANAIGSGSLLFPAPWRGDLTVSAEGYASSVARDIACAVDTTTAVTVHLERSTNLTILVVGPDHKPIRDAFVEVSPNGFNSSSPEALNRIQAATTDDAGSASFKGLFPAKHHVRVTAEGWTAPICFAILHRGLTQHEFTVVMAPGRSLAVHLIDSVTGMPVPRASVLIKAGDSTRNLVGVRTADEQGLIQLTIHPSVDKVSFLPPFRGGLIDIVEPRTVPVADSVAVKIKQASELECVVTREDGQLVTACAIEYADFMAGSQRRSIVAVANERGLFAVPGQGVGSSPWFRIVDPGYGTSKWNRVTNALAAPHPYPVVLRPFALLQGKVTDEGGQGIYGASVSIKKVPTFATDGIEARDATEVASAMTNRDGSFALPVFNQNGVALVVRKVGFAPTVVFVLGAQSGTQSLDPRSTMVRWESDQQSSLSVGTIVLYHGGRLIVTVARDEPGPYKVWMIPVDATAGRAAPRTAFTNAAGIADVSELVAGVYDVVAVKAGPDDPRPFTLSGGSRVQVNDDQTSSVTLR